MDVRWDPEKAAGNRRKHGVRFPDAEGVLHDLQALTIEDDSASGERRYVSIGRGSCTRVLVVVYTYRAEHIRLISARQATHRELAAYEKRI